jgi:pyruvate-formate lyase-activating enzyme
MVHARREYVPRQAVIAELQATLAGNVGPVDWVSFVGSGEPTLHAGLGWMIHRAKAVTTLPIAVITNGALLYLPEVREELCAADLVMPTLGAANEQVYRRIHRPHPETTFARQIEGLAAFRKQYTGRFWVEVMLIRGVNDDVATLEGLAHLLRTLAPDQVHLTLPTRPPAEPWVTPPDDEGLMAAVSILGQWAHVVHPAGGAFALPPGTPVVDGIVDIIARHPMSEVQVRALARHYAPGEIETVMAQLAADKRALVIERHGSRFWVKAGSVYGENGHRPTQAPRGAPAAAR